MANQTPPHELAKKNKNINLSLLWHSWAAIQHSLMGNEVTMYKSLAVDNGKNRYRYDFIKPERDHTEVILTIVKVEMKVYPDDWDGHQMIIITANETRDSQPVTFSYLDMLMPTD